MKHDDAIKLAESALQGLAEELQHGKSRTLVQFLEVMARFPKYSFRNVMLITAQRPDATQIAGFRTWKSLGRFVRHGEHGIGIVAPMVGRKQDQVEREAPRAGDGAEETRFVGFRVVHVFDISQTEGKELPELQERTGDPGDNLVKLEQAIRGLGITLEYAPLPEGTQGMSLNGRIVVRPDLSPAESFAVLAHEGGHELLHKSSQEPRPSKTVRELEAEAVAHVVCQAVGIDSATSSSDYIQLYDGNVERLHGSLQAIQSAAATILVAMSESETTPHTRLVTQAA